SRCGAIYSHQLWTVTWASTILDFRIPGVYRRHQRVVRLLQLAHQPLHPAERLAVQPLAHYRADVCCAPEWSQVFRERASPLAQILAGRIRLVLKRAAERQ